MGFSRAIGNSCCNNEAYTGGPAYFVHLGIGCGALWRVVEVSWSGNCDGCIGSPPHFYTQTLGMGALEGAPTCSATEVLVVGFTEMS